MTEQTSSPRVFISYSHTSLEHVKWVLGFAESLREDGVYVVIDKSHLREGDDVQAFMERMVSDQSISRVIIISDKGYAKKADDRRGGVGTEAQIISPELYSRTEQRKFIPIVTTADAETGRAHLPVFLRHRYFIDLSSDQKFRVGYQRLLDIVFGRLDEQTDMHPANNENPSGERADRILDRYADEYSVLRVARAELATRDALSYATVNAIISSSVPVRILEKWWRQLCESVEGSTRYGVAVSATILLDKRDVGRDALEYCLSDDHLDSWQKEMLAGYFAKLKSESAILWAHQQLVSSVRSDDAYHLFLVEQLKTLAAKARDQMTSYLLSPDRGPGKSNVYSFFLLCSHLDECGAFVERWCEWILAGRFDGNDTEGNESAGTLYRLLSKAVEQGVQPIERIIDTAMHRMFLFLRSRDEQYVRIGLYHLQSMVVTRFRGANRAFPVLHDNVSVGFGQSLTKERNLFYQLRDLLRIVTRLGQAPNQLELEQKLEFELKVLPYADLINCD